MVIFSKMRSKTKTNSSNKKTFNVFFIIEIIIPIKKNTIKTITSGGKFEIVSGIKSVIISNGNSS